METAQPPIHFLNIEYFFRLLYGAGSGIGGVGSGFSAAGIISLANTVWFVITIISYLITLACIGLLVYHSMRLYQITEELDQRFGTIAPEAEHEQVEHSRWTYVKQLIESTQQSDWRTAIIEADIMLDETLTKQGYEGESIGDKLKTANPAHFATLDDAWAAHRVRNDIAHQGSAFELSAHTAYQTIARYENVFTEFHEI